MARSNVTAVFGAWLAGKAKSVGPVSTDGLVVRSYAMPIAVRVGNRILLAKKGKGLYTATTAQHLSSLRELLELHRQLDPDDHHSPERTPQYEILEVSADDIKKASYGGNDAEEVVIRNVDEKVPTPSFGKWRKNPSPAEVAKQFDELIKDPDVAAMDVAEDLAIESGISLVELSRQITHAPWVDYSSYYVKFDAWGYFILDHSPSVPMLVGWAVRKIRGDKYEPEIYVRVSPAYVRDWPSHHGEWLRFKYTFALGHQTTWPTLEEAKEGAARDAWNVAKRVKLVIMEGETPVPYQLLHDEAEAAMLHDAAHPREPSQFSIHYKGKKRDQRGRFRPNPAIDDVRQQYANMILSGMARVLWAHAYGAWAQADILERDPDVIDEFPTVVRRAMGYTDPDGRYRFAADLSMRPPNMPVWLEQAPPTPNAARNAAKWLSGVIVQREQVESVVDLYAIASEIDTGAVFEYVDPTPKPKPDIELFYDGARGTNIPRDFANDVDRSKVTGVSDDDWAILEAGDNEDHSLYWDTWQDVLDNAVITDSEGQKWRLEQDGDLFLIPVGMEWDDDEQGYVWPPEADGVTMPEEFGRCLAHMCLADGISWFDEHKQRSVDGSVEWQPNLPTADVLYDGVNLTWRIPGTPGHSESTKHRIRITFDRYTPGETDEDALGHESGWEDEEGVLIEEDEMEDIVERTLYYLEGRGALEASSSMFHPGVWYTQIDDDTDYVTGISERLSFHLAGYTPEEEKEVYDALQRGRR